MMRLESEIAFRELIEARTREFASKMGMMKLPAGAYDTPEEILPAMHGLLAFLRDNRPGSGEPHASLGLPPHPPPRLNSGGIALPDF